MPSTLTTVIFVVVFFIGAAIAFFLGVTYRKRVAESAIGSAEDEAKRIISDAINTANITSKETIAEAKEEIAKLRSSADDEVRERRSEVQRSERRLQQREESLDKRSDRMEQREESLQQKINQADLSLAEAETYKEQQFTELERIAGLTADQGKDLLLGRLDHELIHEKALRINAMENATKEETDRKARSIIAQAIQRYASDHVAEITVSVVPLPNDEMKGRIIGREGRNIRTIETLTGVDLIIDDTPETITLSSHDPVKREIARIAVEKLIQDGRIHPARIEEMVERATKDVGNRIKEEGERAVLETGVHGLHPEIVLLLGRLCYRTSYGQNVLDHSIEVAHIAGVMAAELGDNVNLAKRAGLLHDIGKALTHKIEGSHVDIGVDMLKRHNETPDVIHAVEAHHGDVQPKTIAACLVQAADAISAARPGARRENIESYIKRLEKLEEITNSFVGVQNSYAIQAGREIRVMVNPEEISDDEMAIIARDICNKIEEEVDYPGQIKVHLIRENRAVEYAK